MPVIARLKEFIFHNKLSLLLFASVGLFTAIFYLSFFMLLWKIFSFSYNLAITIAYISSIMIYFYCQRTLIFKNHSNPLKHQIAKFLVMVGFNYFITLGVVRVTAEILLLPPYLGVIASIGATTVTSYLISKFWIFQQPLQTN